MSHMNFEDLVKFNTKQAVRDMPKMTKTSRIVCKNCQPRKQSRVSFKTNEYATSKPLELVHTDLCGPTRTQILQGEGYFIFLIDDYTRMTWVSFLKNNLRHLKSSKHSNI